LNASMVSAIESIVQLKPTLSFRAPATVGPTICPKPPAMLNIPEKLSLISDLYSGYLSSTALSISGITGITVQAALSPKMTRPIIIIAAEVSGNPNTLDGPKKKPDTHIIKNPHIIVARDSNFLATIGRITSPVMMYDKVGIAKLTPTRKLLNPYTSASLGPKIGAPDVNIMILKN